MTSTSNTFSSLLEHRNFLNCVLLQIKERHLTILMDLQPEQAWDKEWQEVVFNCFMELLPIFHCIGNPIPGQCELAAGKTLVWGYCVIYKETGLWLLRTQHLLSSRNWNPSAERGLQQLLLFEKWLSLLTRCYGWHVPLSAFGWSTVGNVWDEDGAGKGGVNLRCWETAFLKAETHARLHLLPREWAVSHIRAEGGGRLRIQPHWGSGRAARRKQHFSFLNWGCQCVRPES